MEHITESHALRMFLARVPSARRRGKEWIGKCPAHDDRKPSLSITAAEDGRVLIKCHAGCDNEQVVSRLGLDLKDLFPSNETIQRQPARRRIVASYSYTDEGGRELFQVIRYQPKDFRQRKPDGARGWKYSLNGTRRVLYRLPELIAANSQATVFIVEGEKDVDRLRDIGLIATCNPGGAGKWRVEYLEPLRSRDIVILADADASGKEHAQSVAQSLHAVASSVKVIDLPGLSPKGDVSDWLDGGGDAEALCMLAENAPEWRAADASHDCRGAEDTTSDLAFYNLGDLLARVFPPSDPIIYEQERGEFALINAVTNVGKSTWLRNLALMLTCGATFSPILPAGKERRVMLIDFETRRRRLRDDLSRMMGQLTPAQRDASERNLLILCETVIDGDGLCLSMPSHLGVVAHIAKQAKVDLIIIDTYASGFAVFDENSNGETSRRVLRPLARLASEIDAAIILAHHIGKGASEEGRASEGAYRGRGASALGAAAAVVINLTADPHDLNRVVLRVPKLKGKRLEECSLRLNEQTRWFERLTTPVTHTPSSYQIVLASLRDGQPHSRKELLQVTAGRVATRTVEQCLREGVNRGEIVVLRRGLYQFPQLPQAL